MGVFSCFSRAKTIDATDGGDIMYSMDGMELKEGMSPGGSPGKNRRAAGSESLNGSPRKRIDYDALVKAKHMPGTNLHAVATANGAGSAHGNVELANARALVRALARKPESRHVSPCTPALKVRFKKLYYAQTMSMARSYDGKPLLVQLESEEWSHTQGKGVRQ